MGTPLAAILTLGCKLNLADSEAIGRVLRGHGYTTVESLCEADTVVVNTCSVTHVADQKSRKLIRSARRVAPAARVVVTGCFPRTAGDDLIQSLGADLVVGTGPADRAKLASFLGLATGARLQTPVPGPAVRTRAFIKAQEGCNDVCAFCIVPRTRGRERSRPVDDVAADVELAAGEGAKEVVLTGTQLGAWGRDLSTPLAPADLIAGVLAATDIPRLRFSSLQPQDIVPQLLSLWGDPRLMPHFHLALQSGSEAVLQRMRRRYTAREYLVAVERVRASMPGVAITTDIIAGFPGETDEDFEATLAVCRESGFARIHAFPYSPRSRTAAAAMADQVPHEVKRQRMARLHQIGGELSRSYHRAHVGTSRPVLWEDQDAGGCWRGYTDNYIAVRAAGDDLGGRITLARMDEIDDDGMAGEVL
jgi:threonylcarbamoyladenosine tRNA methylthiotransferase MtaB